MSGKTKNRTKIKRKRKFSEKQIKFAEILAHFFDRKKVVEITGVSLRQSAYLRKKARDKRPESYKRLAVYGPNARILLGLMDDNCPLIDVFLFTDFYPSDVIRCLKKYGYF